MLKPYIKGTDGELSFEEHGMHVSMQCNITIMIIVLRSATSNLSIYYVVLSLHPATIYV